MNTIKQAYEQIQLDEQSKQDILENVLHFEPQKTYHKKVISLIMICSCLILAIILSTFLFPHNDNSPTDSLNSSQYDNSKLSHLPSDLTFEQMKDMGFYIYSHGKITNQDVMDQFLNNVENKIPSSIIIVQFTIEGDPFLNEVIYQENNITIYHDGTRDKFGDFPDILKYEYKKIGIYNHILYAYNDVLNEETINDENTYEIVHIKK